MKIVFASYIYSPGYGDPAAWLKRINIYTGILKQLALNHQVVSIEQIDYEGIEIHNNVSFHFKRLSKPGRFLPLRLHRYISSLKPDVVFIHGLHFSLQIVQLRLHLAPEVKILAQHHAEQPHTGIKKRIQQLADKCIDAYLFASVQMGMEWVKRGNLTSPQKIYGVMEVSSVFKPIHKSIAQARTSVNGTPIFLWVGRLNQNKDPLNVVKAFLQFAQINSSARLYMIYQTEELLCDIIELISSSPNAGAIKQCRLYYIWFTLRRFGRGGLRGNVVRCGAYSYRYPFLPDDD
jgi:glycosyltransferase involved in cell wall biosynthesis